MSAAPFQSLDDFVAVPRLTGLVLSPDGSRLVAPVQALSSDRRRYVTALWEIDPGGGPARQLTRSASGEKSPVFLPDGDLLFVSERAEPTAGRAEASDADDGPGLWRLPMSGGEAEQVAGRPGGIGAVLVARDGGTVVVMGSALPGPMAEEAGLRAARRDAGVTAILHETLPVRHWDHDVGPACNRLFAVGQPDETGRRRLRDLTPDAGGALEDSDAAISPDGATIYTQWRVTHPGGRESSRLVAIEVSSGNRRVVAASDERAGDQHDYASAAVAPDGSWVAFIDTRVAQRERPPSLSLDIVDLGTGERRDLLAGFPLWPTAPVAGPDSSAVYFVADEAGHCPAWRVDVATGQVVRLTRSGAYTDLCPSPDGRHVYALLSHIDSPPRPVRLAATAADQDPVFLDAPGDVGPLPGRMEEVEAFSQDGARIRGFLALPTSEGRAPLVVFVHGGPIMSWNSWSWRRNPWLMVARGWAVLLADPGLSRGYGDEFVQRAWRQWGPVPFADLMAITDAVEERDDIDASRTAAMGGSYGGYMANWIAGHTDRFKAIVTHAGLWAMDRFAATTDHPGSWAMEWGYPEQDPERYQSDSPQSYARAITTPMLVTHGDKDYRVPVGEALALWSELVRHEVDAKFLLFPDEGHFVLKPGNFKVSCEMINAFLDHHVLGSEWVRPELL
jgi:dipeptidyl aminopeptidase/acylaminoacyl peptidase